MAVPGSGCALASHGAVLDCVAVAVPPPCRVRRAFASEVTHVPTHIEALTVPHYPEVVLALRLPRFEAQGGPDLSI